MLSLSQVRRGALVGVIAGSSIVLAGCGDAQLVQTLTGLLGGITGTGAPFPGPLSGGLPMPGAMTPAGGLNPGQMPGGGLNPGQTGSPGTVPGQDGGLPVPIMDQNQTAKPGSYCGPTSVAMCMAFFGKNVTTDDCQAIATESAPPIYAPGGSRMQNICPYLKQQGLSGSTYEDGLSLADLGAQTRAGYPVIVHVKGNYGPRSTAGHYVVVCGLTPDGDPIINDPAGGKRIVCDAATFDRAWKNDGGDCVVVRP